MGFTEREYYESIGPERESVTVSHDLTTDSGVKVKLSRTYRSRLVVVDFSPHGEYLLIINNPAWKAKGEEVWKILKVPLQANGQRPNGSSASALLSRARRHS